MHRRKGISTLIMFGVLWMEPRGLPASDLSFATFPLQHFTLANCLTLFPMKIKANRLELTYKEGEIVKSSP